MNVEVTEDCRGCGACEKLCPGAFELVDEQSRPITPIDADPDDVRDTADRCPGGAILVSEAQGDVHGGAGEAEGSSIRRLAVQIAVVSATVLIPGYLAMGM